MLEPTKKPHTEKMVMLTFRGPDEKRQEATKLLEKLGFEFLAPSVPWREAFPEFSENEQGTILKGARLKEGLTQKQLSEKTGIPQRHISEVETGKRRIGRKWAELLAGVLNVSDYRVFL